MVYVIDGATSRCQSGSSPLVRGKLARALMRSVSARIIPACAGQTSHTSVLESSLKDHPRLCGANAFRLKHHRPDTGSSPLVRGKLPDHSTTILTGRIIPACAGQTTHGSIRTPRSTDHPRLCGANWVRRLSAGTVSGSSPLVRGKPSLREISVHSLRIIPACAGQTVVSPWTPAAISDHPRLCGANFRFCIHACFVCGSSPLVRGKLTVEGDPDFAPRIIPACAGQTQARTHRACRRADHPRLCGANG